MESSDTGNISSRTHTPSYIDSHSVISSPTNSEWASSSDGHDCDNTQPNSLINSTDDCENRVRSKPLVQL